MSGVFELFGLTIISGSFFLVESDADSWWAQISHFQQTGVIILGVGLILVGISVHPRFEKTANRQPTDKGGK